MKEGKDNGKEAEEVQKDQRNVTEKKSCLRRDRQQWNVKVSKDYEQERKKLRLKEIEQSRGKGK